MDRMPEMIITIVCKSTYFRLSMIRLILKKISVFGTHIAKERVLLMYGVSFATDIKLLHELQGS